MLAVAVLFVVLRLEEIGLHLGPGPARISQRRPFVVVERVAAYVDHAIDRTRPAEGLAPGYEDRPVVHGLLRLRKEAPIDLAVVGQPHDARRDVDEGAAVRRPCLEQADGDRRVLAQPVGDHRAGRTGADNDIVECRGFVHFRFPGQFELPLSNNGPAPLHRVAGPGVSGRRGVARRHQPVGERLVARGKAAVERREIGFPLRHRAGPGDDA